MTNARKYMTRCPWCGVVHDAVSIADEPNTPIPKDSDITLCFQCGEWATFDKSVDGNLRKPTDAEFYEIGTDIKLRAIRLAWYKTVKPRRPM